MDAQTIGVFHVPCPRQSMHFRVLKHTTHKQRDAGCPTWLGLSCLVLTFLSCRLTSCGVCVLAVLTCALWVITWVITHIKP